MDHSTWMTSVIRPLQEARAAASRAVAASPTDANENAFRRAEHALVAAASERRGLDAPTFAEDLA